MDKFLIFTGGAALGLLITINVLSYVLDVKETEEDEDNE